MSFLLKIVQGPNAGAEIALVEGTTISLGRGDGCDIILTDAALAEKACEIEVTSERVMLLFPDGKQMRMEAFHVCTVGTTALVMGPAEGAWKELVWEKTRTLEGASAESEESKKTETPSEVSSNPKREKRHYGRKIFAFILILFLFFLGCVVLCYFYPEKISQLTKGKSEPYVEKIRPVVKKSILIATDGWNFVVEKCKSKETKQREAKALIPAETLSEIVEEYGLTAEEVSSGVIRVWGDFKTRVERLQATARVYRARPGAELDFSDEESLQVSVEDLLMLVSEGRIRLEKLQARAAKLKGKAQSEKDLNRVLEALRKDVPKLKTIDSSQVTIEEVFSVGNEQKEETSTKIVRTKTEQVPLPIVGILTAPYPCLVLQNGARVMEGARLGEYTVSAITAESVELVSPTGKFTWRP